jgi:hypothetical protein
MRRPDLPPLTDAELAILDVLRKHGPSTVHQVAEHLRSERAAVGRDAPLRREPRPR